VSCEWKRSRRLTIATNAPYQGARFARRYFARQPGARTYGDSARDRLAFDATDQADFNGCFIGRQALRGALR